MANNIFEYMAQLKAKDPKRANWLLDCNDIGTNTFGFIRPKLVKEIIAGSNVTYDFKSAYSSNPTISPVLSRAKVSVCAIWIPLSLYVPAFRDGEPVKAGKTDYSFPTINFNYPSVDTAYDNYINSSTPGTVQHLLDKNGEGLPYIPSNSIFTELHMWRPNFQPVGFSMGAVLPMAKNAIPLLGYYDFFRHYVLNTQSDYFPLRVQGYSVQRVQTGTNQYGLPVYEEFVQEPVDYFRSRDDLDNLFTDVRLTGSNYYLNGSIFDVSRYLSVFMLAPGVFAPSKKMNYVHDGSSNGPTLDNVVAYNDDHFGEVRQTYLGDMFTSYLSNENVEYERSTARVVADDDGVITMEQVYAAQRVQNFIRRTIFRNSDYAEFIDAEYGITPPSHLTKPLFLGKVSTWLTFNDVVSTAQTSDSNDVDSNSSLGSRSSLGFGRMITGKLANKKNRHFVNFTAKEPGYFMVLEWIVPEVAYFQGFDSMYDKHSLQDLYFPAFDKSGYQDKQFKYLNEQVQDSTYGWKALPPRMSFSDYNFTYAQELAYSEYMLTHNRMSGQMSDPGVYRHWVFHREVDPVTVPGSEGNPSVPSRWSTGESSPVLSASDIYVTPEDFTHIFANTQGLDNFQTFYRHELKVYQPISHRFLSF